MKINHILKMKCSFEVKVEEEILKLFLVKYRKFGNFNP